VKGNTEGAAKKGDAQKRVAFFQGTADNAKNGGGLSTQGLEAGVEDRPRGIHEGKKV